MTNTYELRDVGNILLVTVMANRDQRGITVSTATRHLTADETETLKILIAEAITWANSND